MLLIGKSTISMVIFNSYVTNYQRVHDTLQHQVVSLLSQVMAPSALRRFIPCCTIQWWACRAKRNGTFEIFGDLWDPQQHIKSSCSIIFSANLETFAACQGHRDSTGWCACHMHMLRFFATWRLLGIGRICAGYISMHMYVQNKQLCNGLPLYILTYIYANI